MASLPFKVACVAMLNRVTAVERLPDGRGKPHEGFVAGLCARLGTDTAGRKHDRDRCRVFA
jgi:hypothetical protein